MLCLESPSYKNAIARVEDSKIDYIENGDMSIALFVNNQIKKCKDCIAVGFCNGGCPVWFEREKCTNLDPVECGAQREFCQALIEALINAEYSFGWHLEKTSESDGNSILLMTKD